MEIIRTPKESCFVGCDVVVKLPKEREGTTIRLLQLTDMQIIDSLQRRTPDRLRTDEINGWLPETMEANFCNHVKSLVAQAKPDMIIITGDMVYGSFDDKGTTFQFFCDFMNSLKIPWSPVFGNHDNESQKGVDWQCQILEQGEYCLFCRGTVSGNGNYTVGVAVDDVLVRVLHMMDSHGCPDKVGIYEDQLELVRLHTKEITEAQGKKIPAFMGFHHPVEEFRLAEESKGYRTEDRKSYVIGVDVPAKDGDFGSRQENYKAAWTASVPGFLELAKECQVEGVFVGHFHSINTCITYEGIRWVFGLKTGQYDYHTPGQLGGTLITIRGEETEVSHLPSLVKCAPFPGRCSIFDDYFAKNE